MASSPSAITTGTANMNVHPTTLIPSRSSATATIRLPTAPPIWNQPIEAFASAIVKPLSDSTVGIHPVTVYYGCMTFQVVVSGGTGHGGWRQRPILLFLTAVPLFFCALSLFALAVAKRNQDRRDGVQATSIKASGFAH